MKIIDASTVSLEAARAWAVKNGAHQRFVDVAWQYWNIAPRYGIPPEIAYAQAAKETNWGKYGGVVPPEYNNWCGLKTEQGGSNTAVKAHQQFPDASTGVLAHVQHLARYAGAESLPEGDELVDPRWSKVTQFTRDVEGLGGAWAPSRTYGNEVAARVADLRSFANHGSWNSTPTPAKKPHIAIAAGHWNTAGGNHDERETVKPLAFEIARQLRAHGGFDVTMMTPESGNFNGDHNAVARAVVALHARQPVDLYWECHTEGTGNPDNRGAFGVVPWWPKSNPDDKDADAITISADLVLRIRDATGIPIKATNVVQPGVMAEYQTGVGGQGFRLGVFAYTADAKATMTRCIFEYGAHTNPDDFAIQRQPWFTERAARATVEAIAAFYGVAAPGKEPQGPPPDPNVRYFPETGFSIAGGFRAYWEQFGGLAVFGYPITSEYQENGVTVQWFERARFEWVPGSWPERYDVQLGLLGVEVRALQERIEEMEAA